MKSVWDIPAPSHDFGSTTFVCEEAILNAAAEREHEGGQRGVAVIDA